MYRYTTVNEASDQMHQKVVQRPYNVLHSANTLHGRITHYSPRDKLFTPSCSVHRTRTVHKKCLKGVNFIHFTCVARGAILIIASGISVRTASMSTSRPDFKMQELSSDNSKSGGSKMTVMTLMLSARREPQPLRPLRISHREWFE